MGSVGSEKSFLEWRREWHDKYNVTPDYDIDDGYGSMENITLQQRKAIEKELDRFVKEFPEIKGLYTTIKLKDKLKEDSWAGSYDGDTGSLSITDKIFDEDGYKSTLDKHWYAGVYTSFHPQGTKAINTISHELGHALVNKLVREASPKDYIKMLEQYETTRSKIETSILDASAKSIGSTYYNEVGYISHYAQQDRAETIPEAIADYMANGKKANKYSIAIVKELKKRLR